MFSLFWIDILLHQMHIYPGLCKKEKKWHLLPALPSQCCQYLPPEQGSRTCEQWLVTLCRAGREWSALQKSACELNACVTHLYHMAPQQMSTRRTGGKIKTNQINKTPTNQQTKTHKAKKRVFASWNKSIFALDFCLLFPSTFFTYLPSEQRPGLCLRSRERGWDLGTLFDSVPFSVWPHADLAFSLAPGVHGFSSSIFPPSL